jgi:predicted CopG family antitoxin
MTETLETSPLQDIKLKLEHIDRGLRALKKKGAGGFNENDVRPFQDALLVLETQRDANGVFWPKAAPDLSRNIQTQEIPEGQAQASSLLHRCHRLAHELLCTCDRGVVVAPQLEGILQEIEECRHALEDELSLMHFGEGPFEKAHSNKLEIQERLRRLDTKYRREDLSAFYEKLPSAMEAPPTPAPGQAALHEALEACYRLLDEIMGREDVQEQETRNAEAWGFDEEDILGLGHLKNSFSEMLKRLQGLKRKGGYTEQMLQRDAEQLHEQEQKFTQTKENLKEKSNYFDRLSEPPAIDVLINRCYQTLHGLYERGTEVDPKLAPIYEELEGLRDLLRGEEHKLKRGCKEGIVDMKKIQEAREKIMEIENKNRKGGVFFQQGTIGGDKEILKGQAILHDLLANCYRSLRKFELFSA